ncbi:ABC transporter ATP-binding protein [Aneurinibacillus tyrosinisolvens]|uniref:ABC transporter ATP-binding protein n=1 Tax=Aneurinibacillus tyrosinisolvens TaxID=1443435 RepID=UPI00063F5A0B|nr:ABC transporter ATP-binding protein [Aneurinibacillus tyrosinisolvens]
MTKFLIETKGLIKQFKDFVPVRNLDLQVKKGEVYGFLGPNGAGKTTTIRMLLGLIKPTAGEVYIFGKPLAQNRIEILKKVGSMVESPSYYGHLTGFENLEVTGKLLGLEPGEIDRVLEIVRLTEWKDKQVRKYSLGMKQRLGIAQALLGRPELLILDEPTNGLDPAGIHEIRDLIISLPRQMNMTVLVSSHILSEIELVADRVGIIHMGKLLFQGGLQELRERSKARLRIDAQPLLEAGNYLLHEGYHVEKEETSLYIDAAAANAAKVNRKLVENGYEVSHISEDKKSLEDIFLRLTEEAKSL